MDKETKQEVIRIAQDCITVAEGFMIEEFVRRIVALTITEDEPVLVHGTVTEMYPEDEPKSYNCPHCGVELFYLDGELHIICMAASQEDEDG